MQLPWAARRLQPQLGSGPKRRALPDPPLGFNSRDIVVAHAERPAPGLGRDVARPGADPPSAPGATCTHWRTRSHSSVVDPPWERPLVHLEMRTDRIAHENRRGRLPNMWPISLRTTSHLRDCPHPDGTRCDHGFAPWSHQARTPLPLRMGRG